MKKLLSGLVLILLVATPVKLLAITAPSLEMPKTYTSTARIAVQDTGPKINCDAPCPHCTSLNPYFYRTQISILQSKPILYEVANRLNLAEVWGTEDEKLSRKEVYIILKKSVEARQTPNTSLIAITVKRPESNEAAMVANEIAGAYQDYRLDLLRKGKRMAIESINKSLGEQRARVETAEKKVEQVRTELGISEDGLRALNGMDAILLQRFEAERLTAQAEINEKEVLLKTLEGVSAKGVIAGDVEITFDELISRTVQQIKEVAGWLEMEGIQKDANHPDMKRYRLQKEKLEEVLEKRLVTLQIGLEQERKFAKARVESSDKQLAVIRQSATQFNHKKYKPFRIAQDNLESEQFIYKRLEIKLRVELIKLEQEPRSPVEIVSVAMPVEVE